MQRLPILSLILILSSTGPFLRNSSAEAAEIREFIEQALERNPELLALQENIETSRFKAAVAGGYPDPTISYSYFVDEIETRLGPQQGVLQLTQPVPFPGKLSLMEEIAGFEALVAEERLHLARLRVAKEVKTACYSITAVDEILGVIANEKSLLGRFEEVVASRLETGVALQQDLLKIQIERLKLDEREMEFRRRRKTLSSKLNALSNREPDSPVVIDAPAYRGSVIETLDELRAIASDQPELRSARHRIDQRSLSLSLARRKYLPDFMLGMSYFNIGEAPMDIPDSGRDAWNVTFGVRVPLWFGKVRAETKQHQSWIRRLERSYESARSRIMADIEDHYNQYRIAADLVTLYRDELLPRAEQSLAATETGYLTGDMDFLSLLDSERLLLALRIALAERKAEVEIRIAELESIVGRELAGSE